ncbi:hypothetical protein S7711_04816 [Stachybotrys chartarum IBT 7711]|uniref:Uncharacterized protein n=1 Tax=Stachybotrys chartarum (strain CBS 109288 / IBT 7711) TaxID=1280523 RepID=A0A084AMF8_STACB|nr:hypothetical protein S7711_04816 [Stachybotrys chartarum IBT 7711]KFA54908.1 hypothetical protein S40293_02294 [Stachybotrys chartarum IBT 40293]KFA79076.1 hypothetical protein S40288_07025 [Stachybotrys chartarum IBT 40288]
MKFFSFLFMASLAVAAPAMDKLEVRNAIEPRQSNANSAIGTISGTLWTLEQTTSSNLQSIRRTVRAIRANTDATIRVQLAATLEANYQAIFQAIQASTQSITSVTTGAAGGISQSVVGLSQNSLGELASAIRTTISILNDIRVTLSIAVTDLTPDLYALVQDEITAVREAILPFLRPLLTFVQAARDFGVSVGLNVSGLNSAVNSLNNVVESMIGIIGV